jgi:hypothetical protein
MNTIDFVLAKNAKADRTDINAQNMRKLGEPGQTLRALIKAGEDEDLVLVAFTPVGDRRVRSWRDRRVYTPALVCSMVHSNPEHWFVKCEGTAE